MTVNRIDALVPGSRHTAFAAHCCGFSWWSALCPWSDGCRGQKEEKEEAEFTGCHVSAAPALSDLSHGR
jgi:hypothetical protein